MVPSPWSYCWPLPRWRTRQRGRLSLDEFNCALRSAGFAEARRITIKAGNDNQLIEHKKRLNH